MEQFITTTGTSYTTVSITVDKISGQYLYSLPICKYATGSGCIVDPTVPAWNLHSPKVAYKYSRLSSVNY